MNFTIKIAVAALLIFLGTKTSNAQNLTLENQEKNIKAEGESTSKLMKTSNYVLNIKVKRKSNSQKIVVTSMEYVEKQFKLHKILEAQKARISKMNKNEIFSN